MPSRNTKEYLEQLKGHLSPASPKPMEDMASERARRSFEPRDLTYFLDGGHETTELKERILSEIERDPSFFMEDIYDLTKEEWRERTMEKFRSFVFHLSNEPLEVFRLRMELVSLVEPGFWTRIGVHFGLFFGTLRGQATPSQLAFWVGKGAMNLNGVVGCFAMTEIGHGSNVAGMETTATFDEASDQFVVNTPTLTATKWWIGGAAHSATHTTAFCRLIVRGKDYGVKPFVVPLREPKTYKLLPGINIGDCGAKMGRHGIDNGWIQFTNVRIPRSYMLMKYTKVSRDGTVTEPALSQLAYGALIEGRVAMVADAGNVAKKALTIAVRYAMIRRQFSASEESIENTRPVETQIIDYTIHQHRLMPLLAQAFALHFTGVEMKKNYQALMEKLEALKPGDKNMQEVVESLKETHATAAGLKAFGTWNCLHTIEQCRQALGGYGYSAYAGLAQMYNDFAVQCSWEGDNTILTLQAGRYLINCYRNVKKGRKQPDGVAYLNSLSTVIGKKCPARTAAEITDLGYIADAFDVVSANVVQKVGKDFEACLSKGMEADAAYEETAISRLFAAKAHTVGYLFHRFKDGIENAPDHLAPILKKLCALYGLYNIQESAGNFLQYGYYDGSQMDLIKEKVLELCRDVRREAISLVDAFNLPDFLLNTPFGRYDGDVYRHYFNLVKARNPPQHPPAYFERVIKPLLFREEVDMDEPEEEDI